MGKNQENSELVRLARHFLELAAETTDKKSIAHAIEPIKPFFDSYIKGIYWRSNSDPGYLFDDFLQDVYVRLVKTTPVGKGGLQHPVETLKGWIKKTGLNIIADHKKYFFRRNFISVNGDAIRKGTREPHPGTADWNGRRLIMTAENQYELKQFLLMLERYSPALFRYFTTWLKNQTLDKNELALLLNTSPDNIDQMRSRLRQFIEEYWIE